jgi:protein O-mannosyl-transferase
MAAKPQKKSVTGEKKISDNRTVQKSARDQTFQSDFWKEHRIPCLILVALAFLLYASSLSYQYILDDQMVITENQYTQKGFSGLYDIFTHDSFEGYFKNLNNPLEGGRYRPLSVATFAIEIGLFGKNHPGISHFINVLLYGLIVVLVYRVLLYFFPSQKQNKWYRGIPFIAALIYLVHPLHVEVVANIKGRDELLALAGSFLALYASFRYAENEQKKWWWASGLFLFLAMLAKENAITFLAVIPLSLWFVYKLPVNKILIAVVPLALAFMAFVILRYEALGYVVSTGKPITDLINNPFLHATLNEKYATIFLTLGWYLKLLLLPHPLSADYYPYHVPLVSWSDWRVIFSLAVYLLLGLLAILNLKQRKWYAYWILYFLLTLSIVSNLFISVGTFMNERFMFMPSVSMSVALAFLVAYFLNSPGETKVNWRFVPGILIALVIIVGFGLLSFIRIPDWKNALALNTSAVRVSPNSARANLFYATSLREDVYPNIKGSEAKDSLTDTIEHYLFKALAIHPTYGEAWMMRAAVALDQFAVDKDQPKMFAVLDSVIVAIPYHPDFRSLIDKYLRLLATNGGDPELIHSYCYRNGYEFFYKQKNDLPSAIQILECGLETKKEDKRILNALAEIYDKAGYASKAADMRQRAQQVGAHL